MNLITRCLSVGPPLVHSLPVSVAHDDHTEDTNNGDQSALFPSVAVRHVESGAAWTPVSVAATSGRHTRLCPMSTGSPLGAPTDQQSVRLFLLFLSVVFPTVLPPSTLTNLDPLVHVCPHPAEGATQALCCPHMVSPMSLAEGMTMMSRRCLTGVAGVRTHNCARRKGDRGCCATTAARGWFLDRPFRSQTIYSQRFRNGGSACCSSLSHFYIQCFSTRDDLFGNMHKVINLFLACFAHQ